jgi:ribonuclease D
MDTHFLLPLHATLAAGLRERGSEGEARREFDKIASSKAHTRVFDPEGWRKLKGARELDVEGKRVLRALWIAREARASAIDKPPFKVVPETALVQLARTRPTDERAVRAIPGITPRVMERAGEAILQVLRGG